MPFGQILLLYGRTVVRPVANHQHKHSGLKFVTPAQCHGGQADAILHRRERVYEAAKQRALREACQAELGGMAGGHRSVT